MGRPATHPRRGGSGQPWYIPYGWTYMHTYEFVERANVRTCIHTHVHAYIHTSSYICTRTYVSTHVRYTSPDNVHIVGVRRSTARPAGAQRTECTPPARPPRLRRTSATSRASNGCARSSARRSTGSAQRLLTHVARSAPLLRPQGTAVVRAAALLRLRGQARRDHQQRMPDRAAPAGSGPIAVGHSSVLQRTAAYCSAGGRL